ncbi:MAG TPA: bifunctional (p)ppGpp synthetase/guanosine-3',5'-bis(diphosphate) 3'-pyrophosphohydrolase [Polyangiaceae bacterium]|jgi:GTP pyrophosphokinase|nr:bifunctional (p)ppGpp synthetase/guanosine-3',5'-bis(diphosphate) 3'-pyrophosphohydrolase [Polyangiaceae bacterium]
MLALDVIVDRVRSYHPTADVAIISKAYQFSQYAHREQKRKSGDPYFIHPASVAGIITDLKLDTASVCAGLLHDVVEDTPATLKDIEREFGGEITTLVDGVTKLNKINFTSKEDRQAENFRKMVVAMAKDLRVLLVKICDRLDNMRTLEHMSAESQERIARETMEIYAPLTNRLGIHSLKSELEDLSLQYLEPDSYREILGELASSHREREKYIDGVCKTLKQHLAEMGFAADVHGRAKHITSIFRKMREQQCDVENLYDVLAFRICVESVTECYAALGCVHSKWTPIPGRFKDYIALPKPNMYQSLHTAVIGPAGKRVEVQIRTHDMNRVAERGVAAHWQYKERASGVSARDAQKFSWLRELTAFQRDLKDPAEFLESVKIDLFPDEVYVFTPKGEVRSLPRGSTPIDFAYSIHTDVGHRCSGARANGQIVPLRYKLRSGDVIEIMTSSAQHPNKDWLDSSITGKARNRIRSYLRTEQREKSVNLGRELLEAEMHRGGMSLSKLGKNERELRRVLEAHHTGSLEELLLTIGYGKTQVEDVVQVVRGTPWSGQENEEPRPELKPSPIERIVRKVRGRDHGGITVNGVDDVLVRYARCCNPLPGDVIIGFITRGRGVTVHRRECQKAFDTDPERRVEVNWEADSKINRPVQLKVTTLNRPGILANVSQAFSAQKINISEANCRAGDDGRACNIFTFPCEDLAQLKTVMRALTKVKGVVEVERTWVVSR